MYVISLLTGKIYLNGIEIPLDDSTQDFQTYLAEKDIVGVEYVEATPEEIEEVNKPIVPQEITAIKFFIELEKQGIFEDALMAFISTLDEDSERKARISLLKGATFERNNPLLELVGFAFGKSEEDIDQIFINANQIVI